METKGIFSLVNGKLGQFNQELISTRDPAFKSLDVKIESTVSWLLLSFLEIL